MCGIAGKLHWRPTLVNNPVTAMCERMAYRGPNDKGLINLENIALGHQRLSILDLSTKAKQPMVSADGRYYIVYNGEVYNFQEIRNELKRCGYVFKSTSDTEVVLYSYSEWGVECLKKFKGMFSLAIWDAKRKEMFLARDRFGQKPLYFHISNRKEITFASELTARRHLLLCKVIRQSLQF